MNPHAQFLYKALKIEPLISQLEHANYKWSGTLDIQIKKALQTKHGGLDAWVACLKSLPEINNIQSKLNQAHVALDSNTALPPETNLAMRQALMQLKPWRKGPYSIFGIDVDTEWRSDLKWDRIAHHIDLNNKNILDVGCANGYFGWRMLAAGAQSVLGVEPSYLYLCQFLLFQSFYDQSQEKQGQHTLLPLRLEDLPPQMHYFDLVFSMGVLYHRRSVFDHLFELKQSLKSGGEMLLETLVIPEQYGEVLVPKDRYASMSNVWFIPSTAVLCAWIKRVGFVDVRVLDEAPTQLQEQRKTDWIDSQSLEHSLAPNNKSLTIEGYPAPRRAVILARRA